MRNLVCIASTVFLLAFNTYGNLANAQGTLTISPMYISGQPSDEIPLTITVLDSNGDPASDVQVMFSLDTWSGVTLPTLAVTDSEGIAETTLTLPIRSTTLFVSAIVDHRTVLVSKPVKVTTIPHRLVKVSGNDQRHAPGKRLSLPLVVRVEDVKGHALPGKWVTFSVISGGGSVSTPQAWTDSKGEAQTFFTLGAFAGNQNSVEASVRDVPPVTFRATAASIPAKLLLSSEPVQTGFPKVRLAAPLAIQVVDSNGQGVENVIVTFSVVEGSGRVLPSRLRTDADGFAETNFTPKSPGTVRIEAYIDGSAGDAVPSVVFTVAVGDPPDKVLRISGDAQSGAPGRQLAKLFVVEVQAADGEPVVGISVSWTVTAGGGSVSAVTATTDADGQAGTYLTLGKGYGANAVEASVSGVSKKATFRATSAAQVVAGALPAAMYWIRTPANTLHRRVGERVENFGSSVQNATSLAVDAKAGQVYWTEKTGNRTGRIQRADLEGSNVQLVKELTSVPHGIAIDTVRNKLYLTNSWGKIQRLNLDGTDFEPNFITGLDSPKDIAVDVAGGNRVYWTEGAWRVRSANLDGTPSIRNLAIGLGEPLSIAVADGKVYWTERTGVDRGVIRCIEDAKGKRAETLVSLRGVLRGIGVDTVGHKLYWTNARGKIQRADLDGMRIQNVVIGLIGPGDLAIDTSAAAVMETMVSETPVMAPAASETCPAATVLLANYPNPFNPETWIPYRLSKPTDVYISIYAADGQLVRMLSLGHQGAGTYQSRGRAAYWDGRNAVGERVASGTYFYELRGDAISVMRKMVILK